MLIEMVNILARARARGFYSPQTKAVKLPIETLVFTHDLACRLYDCVEPLHCRLWSLDLLPSRHGHTPFVFMLVRIDESGHRVDSAPQLLDASEFLCNLGRVAEVL